MPVGLVALVLASGAAGVVVARLRTVHEPWGRDGAACALIGHDLLAGRKLCSDLLDHKRPAVDPRLAAAELVAGYGASAVFPVGCGTAVAAMLPVPLASAAHARDGVAGRWAARFSAMTCSGLARGASHPDAELFVGLCLATAVALALRRHGCGAPRGAYGADAALTPS